MQESDLKVPAEIIAIGEKLEANDFEAYLVGGCVRDLLRNSTPKDWDIATDATPEEMLEIFPHAHYENKFGTVRVVNDTKNSSLKTVEITTFRTEDIYSDKRHPDDVSFSDSIDEDLQRRDFTINALALNLHKVSRDKQIVISQETIVDNHGGLIDLQSSTLKAVGRPNERLAEDPLRIMRGVRFVAELSLSIDPDTKDAMSSAVNRLNDIAVERIRDEFEKIIVCESPKLGLEVARGIGALDVFLPELTETADIEQNQAHEFDLWTHLVNTLQTAADKDWSKHIRLAGLFHDIAKLETREWDDNKEDWTFHNHEVVGAHMTEEIMNRLKFSKDLTAQVVNLVRWHMFYSDTDDITHSAVRRLVRNVGKENVWDLMKLRRADRLGMGRPKEQPYRLRKYQSMIEEVIRDPVSVTNLAIDGDDVIRETDEEPGPRIGYVLHALLEAVLDDPDINNEQELIPQAKKLSKLPDDQLKEKGEAGRKMKENREKEARDKIREKYYVE